MTYVVRLYDGFDNEWMTILGPTTQECAEAKWNELTKGGTEKTRYEHIDYYTVLEHETGRRIK